MNSADISLLALCASAMLLLMSHLADWQMQCEQHGWAGLLWEPNARGARWPWYADWFPHDAWHWAQVVRNWGALIACMLCGMFWPAETWMYPPGFVALYALTRGLGFSMPRKLLQRY